MGSMNSMDGIHEIPWNPMESTGSMESMDAIGADLDHLKVEGLSVRQWSQFFGPPWDPSWDHLGVGMDHLRAEDANLRQGSQILGRLSGPS